MARPLKLSNWLLLATFLSVASAACGDDDDSDTNNAGGHVGTSGSTQGGGTVAGSSSLGGDGDDGNSNSSAGAAAQPSNGGSGGSSQPSAGGAGESSGGAAGAGGADAVAGAGGALPALTDAQILLLLDTLNQGEVNEAYAALPRVSDADVKDFAQMMITDHGAARQEVLSAADSLDLNPAPSSAENTLRQEAETHVAALRSAADASVDATYIHLEVSGHAEALAVLSDLQAQADAAELRSLIEALTATVQEHYDTAQAIEHDL
jgi:putative membrane protein